MRRRQRRLRQWLRHERLSVAVALAETQHHTSRCQKTARAGGGVRDAVHGEVPEALLSHEPGTLHFTLDDDDSLPELGGSRPDRLDEVRPQERVLRNTVEQTGDVALGLPALDAPVPQMVDQPVDILKIIFQLSPAVEEQVVAVPKIIQDPTPQRLEPSEPQQLVEQLVEVPLPNPVLLAHGRAANGIRWCQLHRDGAIYWWMPGTRYVRWSAPQGITASPGRYTNTGQWSDGRSPDEHARQVPAVLAGRQ